MDKAIKKSFGKIQKDASKEERTLLKKDKVLDKKVEKCERMSCSGSKAPKGMKKKR